MDTTLKGCLVSLVLLQDVRNALMDNVRNAFRVLLSFKINALSVFVGVHGVLYSNWGFVLDAPKAIIKMGIIFVSLAH